MNIKKMLAICSEKLSKLFVLKMDYDYTNAREILASYSEKPQGHCFTENNIRIDYDLQVVIPAYNVEEHLNTCLQSIRPLFKSKYRVIVQIIDDGSTDSTSRIVDRFSDTVSGNICVIHQNNKGLSSARNVGLQTVRGRYIMFLDSDDYLPESFDIEQILGVIEDNDILQGSWLSVDTSQKFIQHKTKKMSGYAWGKLYYYKVFENFKFPEGYWFEDTPIKLIISGKELQIKVIDDCFYCYRVNPNGITSKAINDPKIIDTYWITELCFDELIDFGVNYDQSAYDRLLHQSVVNQIRIRKQPSRIRRAVFTLTAEIIEKYFRDMNSIRYTEIEDAIKKREFYRFELLTIANWWNPK